MQSIDQSTITTMGKLPNEYMELIKNFKNFIKKYPQSPLARVALTTIISSLHHFEDYDEMKTTIEEVLNDKNLNPLKDVAEILLTDFNKDLKDSVIANALIEHC